VDEQQRTEPFEGRFHPRATFFARLLLTLSGIALLSTALALTAQDLVLARDLEKAAIKRLESAAKSTERLAEVHLAAVAGRYRAISGTPQFRANLEVQHAPTLRFYAQSLQQREGAALLVFLDSSGATRVAAGDESLTPRRTPAPGASLVGHGDAVYTEVTIPIGDAGAPVGWLVALEALAASTISDWAELTGAQVSVEPASAAGPQHPGLVRRIRDLGDLELRVTADLSVEREALRHSRVNLLGAGAVALAVSLLASVFLSRSVVRPIREIRDAAERIGRGDLGTGLDIRRRDEIGQVARAFDWMRGRLGEQRQELDERMQQLDRSQERLASAQRIARLGSFTLDLESGELHGSDVLRELFDLPPGPGPIDPQLLLSRLPPEDREELQKQFHHTLGEGTPFRADHRVLLGDGHERILHSQAHLVRDDLGRPITAEGTVQDVTERQRAEEQIRFLAYHDSLTGLGNRRLFGERLEHALAQASRRGKHVGVLFLDLDLFKRINDTLGHTAGDELLQKVAGRLARDVRDSDTIARDAQIQEREFDTALSRLGGDEFTILMTNIDDPQSLSAAARRLLESLSRPYELKGHEVVISASIGIATAPDDGSDAETLLRNADSAMYHAKKRGRNNYQFYANSMNAAAMERLSLEAKLRRALTGDDFHLHYQPRVALSSGCAVSFEALARWHDPELGKVAPSDFIPVAEESGLIVDLGRRVLRDACAQVADWQRRGSLLPVAVNLSVHQFRTGSLIEDVEQVLAETGADPRAVEMEITESALAHDERAVIEQLEALRALGLRIALDDFGTGFSSLSMLRRMPVDVLKVDMSFVAGIVDDPEDAALTEAIVAMGKALGLRVVAEGVENEQQLALLRSWRCDEVQGYLVSPAVPVGETERFRSGTVLL
jgi:diguanylate cyclase (GGDEF)-like protein